MTVRRWLAVLAAVALLAGCSGDPKPKFSPTSSAPTSSSPSPDKPKPWEEKSKAGAVAFAKHWVDVFNTAQATGETRPLDEVSSPHCGSCANFIKITHQIYDGGGSLQSDGWAVRSVTPGPRATNADQVFSLAIRQSPQKVTYADGSTKTYTGGTAVFTAALVWAHDDWQMTRMDIVE